LEKAVKQKPASERKYTAAEILARAEAVENLPHVKAWIQEFNALTAKMPKEIWIYVGGKLNAIAFDEDGKIFARPYGRPGTPPEAIVHGVKNNGKWDGGDW
jgi:hypothetical protein